MVFFIPWEKSIFLSATGNASKVYATAVAKTQKIWGAYLEAIMKVLVYVIVSCLQIKKKP